MRRCIHYSHVLSMAISWLSKANGLSRLIWLSGCNFVGSASENATFLSESLRLAGEELEVVVVKIGGSSLTDKAKRETVNPEALEWFSQTILDSVHQGYTYYKQKGNCSAVDRPKRAYVIVHGAGKVRSVSPWNENRHRQLIF